MRALVTGCNGFIGRHVVPCFRGHGVDVCEYSGDVCQAVDEAGPVDVVIHLAAVARGESFRSSPAAAYETNVVGTYNVLEYCRRTGARCVFASTSALYGPVASEDPIAESRAPDPRSPYALSKYVAERICAAWARATGGSVAILRLFNVYGPGQRPPFIVPYLVDQLRNGLPVRLENPDSIRDMVYVEDVAESFRLAAQSAPPGMSVFNIGTGRAVWVRDLASAVALAAAVGLDLEPAAAGDRRPDMVVADPRRASEALGWRASISLEEGLRRLVS